MSIRFNRLLQSLVGVIIFVVLITASSHALSDISSPLTFTSPSTPGTTLPALDDFATTVMGDAWDMNEPTDLWAYRDTSQMVNSSFNNGLYTAQMTDKAGTVTLLTAGATNNAAMRVGKTGYAYPINANKYRYLSYRFYKSNAECNSALVMWYGDDSRTTAVTGFSNSYPACETNGPGWHTKVIDLATIGIQAGEKEWSGAIRELALKPFAGPGADGATFKLDWVRLTSEDPRTARPYMLEWSDGSNASIDLYASQDQALDETDVLIDVGVDGTQGNYTFQSGILAPGSYHIAAVDNGSTSWSTGRLIINTPPQITITKPSMLSGQEYATAEKDNAWDMNDGADLNDKLPSGWETCASNPSFTNGLYTAVLTGCSTDTFFTDPKFILGHMNPEGKFDPVIDTSKYRYLSFRYYLHGEQNIGEGWVARFGWWQKWNGAITNPPVMSRDIMLLEGWNTYKIDLWAPDVVDENHPVQRSWLDSAPNRLRFDPAELYTTRLPSDIEMDWIKLTAPDEVGRGELFNIEFETETTQGATVTFYYDTDTNPSNGRDLITQTDVASSLSAPDLLTPDNEPSAEQETPIPTKFEATSTLYLPLAMSNHTMSSCDDCVQWDTSNVAAGQYYVCAEIDDAYNSTYRCSDAPVIVR